MNMVSIAGEARSQRSPGTPDTKRKKERINNGLMCVFKSRISILLSCNVFDLIKPRRRSGDGSSGLCSAGL